MKKSIAVFGGSLFQDIKYENGKFIPTSRQAVIKLSNEYRIDNFSFAGLKINRVKGLIKKLMGKENYSDCILALGEADLNAPIAFQLDLQEIIDSLTSYNIRPLLVSLPKELMSEEKGILIQKIIDEVAVKKNVDYIYEGKTSKQVSYMVLENEDWTSAILNLC